MKTIALTTAPSMPRLYAKAGLASLRPVRRVAADSLPEVELELADTTVAVETLTAYHRLVGGRVTDHVESVALHGLGFPVALALMARPDFPLPLAGTVHLRNEARLLKPVRAGETLTVRAHAENLAAHHAGVTVDVVTELYSGSRLVHVSRSLYLAKGVALEGTASPARPVREEFDAPIPQGRWKLAASTGRAWAEVLGDWNPIHVGALPARALGRKTAIAHGTYLAARALEGLSRADTPHEWDITFAAPVALPGVVSFAQQALPASGEQGTGHRFVGWDARRGREHFSGSVRPL
jgi:acyl dehydratase